MSLSAEGKQIRNAIRSLMKKKRLHYVELAQTLKISVPTVKRMLTQADFPIERLIAIAAWLGVGFQDLIDLALTKSGSSTHFTDTQEEYFIREPRGFLYFHRLYSGVPKEKIKDMLGLSGAEERRILSDLDRVGLIERIQDERVRLKGAGFFRMQPKGKMEKIFFPKMVEAIWKNIRKRVSGFARAEDIHDPVFFIPYELTLREEHYRNLTRELQEVIAKYRAISTAEIQLFDRDKLLQISGLLMASEFDCWPAALNLKG
jgi:hypothetical protein